MYRKQAIDSIVDLKEKLSQNEASRQLSRYILPQGAAANVIKSTTQKAQATTADRTIINLPQQYCWHTLANALFSQLRETNTGLFRKTWKLFGELISHFIVGLDDMCLVSDAFGDLHVIGATNKKKHEAMIADR